MKFCYNNIFVAFILGYQSIRRKNQENSLEILSCLHDYLFCNWIYRKMFKLPKQSKQVFVKLYYEM